MNFESCHISGVWKINAGRKHCSDIKKVLKSCKIPIQICQTLNVDLHFYTFYTLHFYTFIFTPILLTFTSSGICFRLINVHLNSKERAVVLNLAWCHVHNHFYNSHKRSSALVPRIRKKYQRSSEKCNSQISQVTPTLCSMSIPSALNLHPNSSEVIRLVFHPAIFLKFKW